MNVCNERDNPANIKESRIPNLLKTHSLFDPYLSNNFVSDIATYLHFFTIFYY